MTQKEKGLNNNNNNNKKTVYVKHSAPNMLGYTVK